MTTRTARVQNRRGERTSEMIRSAALELFHKRGFQATTLRDIAANVGIQVGSLYNHIVRGTQIHPYRA